MHSKKHRGEQTERLCRRIKANERGIAEKRRPLSQDDRRNTGLRDYSFNESGDILNWNTGAEKIKDIIPKKY